jgi:arsenate reductase (glutaredoxin)
LKEEITIYHNNRCSKSREALHLMVENQFNFKTVDYLKDILSEEELTEILVKLGVSADEILRKGEKDYTELVKGKNLSESALIETMVRHPKLIERPIITRGNKAIIGRPPGVVVDFLK